MTSNVQSVDGLHLVQESLLGDMEATFSVRFVNINTDGWGFQFKYFDVFMDDVLRVGFVLVQTIFVNAFTFWLGKGE